MKSLFLFLLFLSFLETIRSQIADKYCMLKYKDQNMENDIGTAFYWARQRTVDDCKNLCMVRKDCISVDYDNDNQMCRAYEKYGCYYVKTTQRNAVVYIKYPTSNCEDNTQLDKAFDSKQLVTNADGTKYIFKLQISNTWFIDRQKE
ncbi:hypothetical protein L3Y34_009153 [Caenorhabditis briggsae]|uniref:Apple domain-containing protein n=1 Tax=Caenorhabditis briggsae TaxID=6238 RepID=A0AAE9A7M8_CAEBR|nr:hypothetical protein L3Y34_009153 [Caenorhabditis briggsae]